MRTSSSATQRKRHIARTAMASLLLSAAAVPASAQFQLVNDFENGMGSAVFSNSNVNGVGSSAIVADPAVPQTVISNQVLSLNAGTALNNNGRVVMPIPVIADDTTGTVFFRIAVDTTNGDPDGGLIVSPLEAPTGYGNGRVMMIANAAGQLRYRDGNAYETALEVRENLTWYKAWMVIDNTTNTSSLYLQGGALATQTLANEDAGFRNDTQEEELKTILLNAFAGGSAPALNATFYYDDIYVDPTGENLTDPTALERPSLAILKTAANIAVDGTKDTAYTLRGSPINRVPVGHSVQGGAEDISGIMYGAWTDEGIYLFLEVTDDVHSSDHGGTWNDDSVEFHFDPDNSRRVGNYDGINDVKVSIFPREDGTHGVSVGGFPPKPAGSDFTDLETAVVLNDNGYTVEAFFPWAGLQIQPTGDWTLGLDVQIGDDDGNDLSDPADGTAERESILTWSGQPVPNLGPQNFGELVLKAPKEIHVNSVTAAVAIDGVKDTAYNNSWNHYTDGRWTDAGPHPDGTSVVWQMVHDASNVYLFFSVTDAHLFSDTPDAPHRDDGFEIFFDGNNNKRGNFDNVDDVKLYYRPHFDDALTLDGGAAGFPAPPPGTDFSGLEAAYVMTDKGWDLEVKVPMSVFGFTPEPGKAFGFDFAYNDDNDGGDTREGTLTWNAGVALNFATNAFGTAYIFAPEEAEIPLVESAPQVDGNVDDTYEAAAWYLISRTGGNAALPAASDLSAFWTAVHDNDSIYIVVDVIDDIFSADSGDGLAYQDDSLEIFFDPSNNGTGNFDTVEDIKITLAPKADGTISVIKGGFPTLPAGADFSVIVADYTQTTLGWRVEVKVPFSLLNLNPSDGHVLGLDFQINDDDGVDTSNPPDGISERSSYITWSAIKAANLGTDHFGNVTLVGGGTSAEQFSDIIGATPDTEANYYTSWFGEFYEEADYGGWIYHEGLGWLWVGDASEGEAGFWFYSESTNDWGYADSGYANYLFFYELGWTYYAEYDEGNYLYVYQSNTWQAVGQW